MKCPICGVDHFMLCHSCPHQGHLQGKDYHGSPCEYCDKDARGKQRLNDSREEGHSRVASLEQLERYIADSVPDESGSEDVSESQEAVLSFIRRFCTLDIRVQFMFEQREFFGKSLEDVAAKYRREFGDSITPAGVSAALKTARSRIRKNANLNSSSAAVAMSSL